MKETLASDVATTKTPELDTNKQRAVFVVKSKSEDRLKKILRLLSALMDHPLSDQELEMVVIIHKAKGEVTKEVRQEMRDTLSMSADHVNNYIGRLKKKRIVVETEESRNLLLNKTLRNINVEDEANPCILLFKFTVENPSNEKHAIDNRADGPAVGT